MESLPSNSVLPTPSQYKSWESSRRPVTSVSTRELYDRWASIYDSDGNILQAIDDLELPSLLNEFCTLLAATTPTQGVKITELGCGTGRNTIKLLSPSIAKQIQISQLVCLDLSEKMIDVARSSASASLAAPAYEPSFIVKPAFHVFDALKDPVPSSAAGADGVISTLVLEHLPLDLFFSTIKKLLRPGGVLLLTNMHSGLGNISQAGFLDTTDGVKVQGTSFAYTIPETIAEAVKFGFKLVGEMKERGVEEKDLDIIGGRGGKWVGVKVWYGGVFKLDDL